MQDRYKTSDAELQAQSALFIGSAVMSGMIITIWFLLSDISFQRLTQAPFSVKLVLFGFLLVIAVVFAVINSIVAAIAVRVAEFLSRVSRPDTHTEWSRVDRLLAATFWPFVFSYWLVIAPAYAIITRLFRR